MKKLIAFFLVVSMLLTVMAPCVYGASTQCPVCGRNHILQNDWQDCPEACKLASQTPSHLSNPHRWYECPECSVKYLYCGCSNNVTDHSDLTCPNSNLLWNETIGAMMNVDYPPAGIEYRRPIYCTNCGYWGYHYENECNVNKSDVCDHGITLTEVTSTWYEQNNSEYHIIHIQETTECQFCNQILSTNSSYYSEIHSGTGTCSKCGYMLSSQSCNHSSTELIFIDEYYDEYNSTYHYYYEEFIRRCKKCGEELEEYTDKTKEKHYYKNGSNKCYYCKYPKQTYNEPPPVEIVPDLVIGIGEKTIYVNGTSKTWSSPAKLISGVSYVPVKLATQALGGYLSNWDQNNLTAVLVVGNKTLQFTYEQKLFYLNGYAYYMSNKATIIDGTMYVPAKDFFSIFGKITNYKDEYLVVTNQWISQDQIEAIIEKYYDVEYDEEEEEPSYNEPDYLNEMQAGNLYAVGNEGYLYKRVYDPKVDIGYQDYCIYKPKTIYDSFTLPIGELLIQKGDYLYDKNGNKVSANSSIMLKCDQRIADLKVIETGAKNAYNAGTINSTRKNSIINSVSDKLAAYKQVKRGSKTLSSIAEQQVSYKAKTGSDSSIVTEIQQKLYDLGFTSQLVTGYYGDITFNNIAYFQITNDLDVTGWVDTATYDKLFDTLPNLKYLPVEVDIVGITYNEDNTATIVAKGNTYCDEISVTISGNGLNNTKTLYGNNVKTTFNMAGAGEYTVTAIAHGYFTPLSDCEEVKLQYNTYINASDLQKLYVVGLLAAKKIAIDFLKGYMDTLNGITDSIWLTGTYGLYAETEVYTNRDKTVVYLVSRGVTDGVISLLGMMGSGASGGFAIITAPTGAGIAAGTAGMIYCGSISISAAMDTGVVAEELFQLMRSEPGTTGRKGMANKTDSKTGVKFDENGFPEFESYGDVQLDPSDYMQSRNIHFKKASKALYEKAMKNPEIASKFTPEDIELFKNGKWPDRFTWHHHQDTGLMQLVDFNIHKDTWHIGGFSIWGPGN